MKEFINTFPGKLKLLVIMLPFLCISTECVAQTNEDVEIKIKAAYIYNLTKFVYWEESSTATPVTIYVLGADQIADILQENLPVMPQGRTITVEKITNKKTDFSRCQLVYIGQFEQQHMQAALSRCKDLKILTVSDIKAFAQQGGMIGFVVDEDKVKMEINLNAAKSAGIKISSKLLEIAKKVYWNK